MKTVRVYRNLHKKCLSVLHRTEKGWRLLKHVDRIELENVKFKVSQVRRERVLLKKRKNVHAVVEGSFSRITNVTSSNLRLVKYNPYIAGHFFDQETGQPVKKASWAFVNQKGIMAIDTQ
jgi:hypothetical protein